MLVVAACVALGAFDIVELVWGISLGVLWRSDLLRRSRATCRLTVSLVRTKMR